MPTTYPDAVDEMFGMVKTAWEAGANALAGYIPEIKWPGQPKTAFRQADLFWARVSTQIVQDRQASLANAQGKRRYTAKGLLYFQLFCPRTRASTLDTGRLLAALIKSAFSKESPSGVVWFMDQQIRELPSTEENYPINVVITFNYDSEQ